MNNENKKTTVSSKGRSIKVIVAVLVSAVVLLNVAVGLIPDRYRRIDLTSADSYTLSDSTVNYLRGLDEKITLYVISADGSDVKYEYLLKRIDGASKNIDIKWVSSEDAKALTDPLGVTEAVTPYFVVAESDKRSMFAPYSELIAYRTDNSELMSFLGVNEMSAYEYEYYKQMLAQYAQTDSEYAESYASMLELLLYEVEMYFTGEAYISKVIEYVTVESIPTRYVLTGHGETPFSETELGYYVLGEMGLDHKELDTAANSAIPDDAVSILVIHPKYDITKDEADMFLDYLNGGGQMTFFTAEENLAMPNLMSVINAYGLSSTGGAVSEIAKVEITDGEDTEEEDEAEETEKQYETVYRSEVEVSVNTGHKAMSELEGQSMSPSIVGGNAIDHPAKDGFELTPILTTSESSYIGDNTSELAPRTLAALSESAEGGKLMWFTGAQSFTEPRLQSDVTDEQKIRVYSNIVIVISSFGLAPLTYDSELTILPDAKFYDARLMTVTETNFTVSVIVTVVAVIILSVIGAILCYKRRKA